LRALALVPLRHRGVVLGMMNLASFKTDEFAPRLRLGIELIGSQAAAALARIAAEESLRRSEAHLRTLINSSPIALFAVDAQGRVNFEDGQALNAMDARPAQHVGQLAEDLYADFPLMQENIKRASAAETFSSVVQFGENVLDWRFTPSREGDATCKGFIAVATDITERFRLEQQILEISDKEQARIGQDVHDGLCQQLVGAAFMTNSLEHALAAENRPEAAQVRKVCQLMDEAITESRRVARGLYPVRLAAEGLAPALSELTARVAERFNIQCDCQVEAGLDCEITTATHLYRIAQEAINNAVKHSGAKRIELLLNGSNEQFVLEVSDNGRGMEKTAERRGGMGLYTMDYRARSLGATLSIKSDKDGTTVSCEKGRSES
jgi:signal transduction histidine kinase